MKKLFILITTVCFFSCKEEKKEEPVVVHPLHNHFYKIFRETDNFDNSLVREEISIKIDKSLDSLFNSIKISNLDYQLLYVKKNPHGKGALVHFYYDGQYENIGIGYDILGFMSEELAKKIIKDEKYFLYFKNLKRLDKNEVSLLTNYTFFDSKASINEGNYNYRCLFNLGNFICEIDSVQLAKLKQ